MLNMKKDMGGAATALALAHMMMVAQAASAAARADPGGGEFDLRHELPPARRLSARARASPSRSATPTPKAGWCWPMRWRWPTRRSPNFIDRLRHADRRGARRARPRTAAVVHRRRSAGGRRCRARRRPRTIRCGACRCGRLTRRCSIPRSPTPTMSRPAGLAGSITAALFLQQVRQPRQSLGAFRHLCLDAMRPSRAGRKAANARPPARSMRCCASGMRKLDGRSIRALTAVPPRSRRRAICKARSRPRASSTATLREVVEPHRRLRREPRTMRRSTPRR